MNRQRLQQLGAAWGALFAPGEDGAGEGAAAVARLFDRSPELMDAAEQVAAEQRGRVLIVAQEDGPCRWLLAQMRRQPAVPSFHTIAREGLFTLACLPGGQCGPGEEAGEEGDGLYGWGGRGDKFDLLAEELLDVDLTLFLIAVAGGDEGGGRNCDTRTFARLRSAGAPVLPVVLQAGPEEGGQAEEWRRLLGIQPVILGGVPAEWWEAGSGPEAGAGVGEQELLALIDRMLGLRPRLAIALAQEVPFCRGRIAERVVRTGAWMTAMVGLEPIPLLDLPLQVALQWKVVLQIGAIYGRPGLDVRSKEMAGTVGLSMVVRMVAQQLAKLVPVAGWIVSSVLSGMGTLLLGRAFVRYCERGQVVDWQAAGAVLQERRQRVVAPVAGVRRRLDTLRFKRGGKHA